MNQQVRPLITSTVAGLFLLFAGCGDQTPGFRVSQEPVQTLSERIEATTKLNQALQARLDLMPAVALWKWQEKQPVEDLKRERLVLDRVAELAEEKGVCPDEVQLFFQAQIEIAKAIQVDLHNRWNISPPGVRSEPNDIAQVRQKIDALTPEILDCWIEVQKLKSVK